MNGPLQRRVLWRKKIIDLSGQAGQSLRRLVAFDPEESGGGVFLQLGTAQVQAALVEEQVGQPGQVLFQLSGDANEVALQSQGRAPAALAVVEHQGEHGGKAIAGLHLLLADALFEQQAHVGQQPHGHEGIGGGLELQQQIEVDPAVFLTLEPQAPDEVAVALAEVLGDETVANPLQSGEVELLDPVALQEPSEKLLYDEGVGEEPLVAGVVSRA